MVVLLLIKKNYKLKRNNYGKFLGKTIKSKYCFKGSFIFKFLSVLMLGSRCFEIRVKI